MEKLFKHYQQYNQDEFDNIWENGLFVFDANVLLNMYRYKRETVDIAT